MPGVMPGAQASGLHERASANLSASPCASLSESESAEAR